ncbi:MAG: hypothetical protein HKN79_11135, partial [Flavobacteriales bacterium]|nr:hypothetical protein [Flavobacteriales bacterium]
MIFTSFSGYAQPTFIGTQLVDGSYQTHNLNDLGAFRQVRLQSTSGATGRVWEFATGDYFENWRPYTAFQTLAGFDQVIDPATEAASARYNSSYGGQSGELPSITSGNYYTINVTEYAPPTNQFMAILETSFNPATITTVTNDPPVENTATDVDVTLSAAPSAGEFVYVRYSSDGFATSNYASVSFTGANGTASLPGLPEGATMVYYVLSSSLGSTALGSEVGAVGAVAYDMATLNLNNNGGANYSYTVPDTTPPNILSVSISSDNADPTLARTGDVISIAFTTDETPDGTPTATIQGNTASVSGSGTSWTATWTVQGSDTNGPASFSITIQDAAGNPDTATATTDASSVSIDT